MRIQNIFKECQQENFFTARFLTDARRYCAKQDLQRKPAFFPNKTQKRKYDEDLNNEGSGRGNNRDRSAWKKNPRVNPEWKFKNGENVGNIFQENRDKCSQINCTVLCSNFHIRGSYFESCPYDHKLIDRGPRYIQRLTRTATHAVQDFCRG